jgi:hypothetical protein
MSGALRERERAGVAGPAVSGGGTGGPDLVTASLSSVDGLPDGKRGPDHRAALDELGSRLDAAMDRVDQAWAAFGWAR